MDPLASTIDIVIGQLVDLLRSRAKRRSDFITNHVEPIFEMLKNIHSDYISGFIELEKILADPEQKEIDVFITAHRKADMLRHIRIHVVDLSTKLARSRHKDWLFASTKDRSINDLEGRFFGEVVAYFEVGCGKTGIFRTRGSAWKGTVKLLEMYLNGEADRLEVMKALIWIRERQIESWEDISSAYTDYRLACM